MEEATLLEVRNSGEELILLDGRHLMVNPGDMPTACIWLPTTELEILSNDEQAVFGVIIRNRENDEKIRAAWF